MEKKVMIEFKNFGFQYNAQAEPTLYGIDLAIREGEKILIAGPSGCGKSTIAHCINGLIPNFYPGTVTGDLEIMGKNFKELSISALSKIVGTVLQDSDGQFIGMTVGEDIAFSLENDCVSYEELHERVRATAAIVGIEDHLDHAPTDISGGQKQRVSLAGVMVDDVPILLFDEPLANLDPATGKTAIDLIDRIQKESGATVIIIEHRLEDVLYRDVDRVILMKDGHIISDSTPDELLSSYLLIENGIREPLYITAMKYAGLSVTTAHEPHSIRTLKLSEEEKAQLRNWFETTEKEAAEDKKDILLSASHIDFRYDNGFHALKDISMDVKKGELLAIVGRNGAGKSTFSKIICGFEKQQGGTLILNGEDMKTLSIKERADHIGYVMQNPNQMISKPMIFDEVAVGLRTRGIDEATIQTRVEETLKICGLYPMRKWPVSALSYGQKKRVTIASILVLNPEIIILDEPTAGQDFRHYTDIMNFLQKINNEGITVIMVTHDMHLMQEYADRSVVFSDGQLIADDTGANILTNPDIVERASLKETSLFDLAVLAGIDRPRAFVQHFINYDREVRK